MEFPRKWIIAALNMSNIFEVHKKPNGGHYLSGGEGEFLQDILTKLGIDFEIAFPKDMEFGRELTPGNWTGIIGMVNRGEADIGISGLGIFEDRFRAVDFSFPYTTDGITFVMIKQTSKWEALEFIRFFDLWTWFSILGSLLFMTTALFMITRHAEWFDNILLDLFRAILKQPLNLQKNHLKTKFITCSWLILTSMLAYFYWTGLQAFLTKPAGVKTVETFHELSEAVDKGALRAFVPKSTFALPFVMNSPEESIRLIGRKIAENNWYLTTRELMTHPLQSKDAATIASRNLLKFMFQVGEFKSRILISKHETYFASTGMALRKDFCCTAELRKVISRLISAGIFTKCFKTSSFKNWLATSKPFEDIEEDNMLAIEDFSDVFLMFSVGLFLALLVFLAEILVYHLKQKRTKRN
ncbi:putative glutamate receptor [Trichonephila inaurata madagascariensis]|uniref:Putative glutamate receptor n=1 Tax=Trichonephila inaurata madagascariensis TaxID=2747483 RepID=A0A8X7C8J1_9ARAC|nr:putative glutamate receptor [Trichonephila inaurata madagascariensis]